MPDSVWAAHSRLFFFWSNPPGTLFIDRSNRISNGQRQSHSQDG